jgi:hypothetical protein
MSEISPDLILSATAWTWASYLAPSVLVLPMPTPSFLRSNVTFWPPAIEPLCAD